MTSLNDIPVLELELHIATVTQVKCMIRTSLDLYVRIPFHFYFSLYRSIFHILFSVIHYFPYPCHSSDGDNPAIPNLPHHVDQGPR